MQSVTALILPPEVVEGPFSAVQESPWQDTEISRQRGCPGNTFGGRFIHELAGSTVDTCCTKRAVPTCSASRYLHLRYSGGFDVPWAGLEPATFPLGEGCSIR